MNKITKETHGIFWRHSIKYKWPLFVILVGIVLTTAIDLCSPFFTRAVVDIFAAGDRGRSREVVVYVAAIFGLSLVHAFTWRVMGFTNNKFQPRVMSNLYNTCFDYILGHSQSFFANTYAGSIITRIRRYPGAYENIADQYKWNIGRTLFRCLLITVIMCWQYPIIGMGFTVWCILFVTFAYRYAHYKYPADLALANHDSHVSGRIADTVANATTVQLFAAEEQESRAFHTMTEELYVLRKRSWDLGQYAEMIQGILIVTLAAVVNYQCFYLWYRYRFTAGDYTLVSAYLSQMFGHLWDLSRQIRQVYESLANADEMTEMLVLPPGIVDAPEAKELVVTHGRIRFSNAAFGYEEGASLLGSFSLDIQPQEKVAFVGRTGAGKSTITKLLLRFYDLTSGHIYIDGQDIARVTKKSLREQISYVPQTPDLFHRSLLENIRYGKPNATEEEVIVAAKLAYAHDFIISCKDGYNTLVGERGVKLSGGERQRIAIARAILKNAPILILDEATSSLDSESERYIQNALENLMSGKTVIVVAHRLSTIRQVNRIIVLDSGEIIEEGGHEELLKAEQGTYQKLWGIQVGGFASCGN